jgi:hypothetical protein
MSAVMWPRKARPLRLVSKHAIKTEYLQCLLQLWHLLIEFEREVTLVEVVRPHVAVLTPRRERPSRRVKRQSVNRTEVPFVQASHMSAVRLVVKHRLKLAVTPVVAT